MVHHNLTCISCREGDLVTITERADITKALEELMQSADKLLNATPPSNRTSVQQMLPPLRLQLVPVASQVRLISEQHALGPPTPQSALPRLCGKWDCWLTGCKLACLMVQADVPKPPREEVTQLDHIQQARRVIQAQALGQAAKKVTHSPLSLASRLPVQDMAT